MVFDPQEWPKMWSTDDFRFEDASQLAIYNYLKLIGPWAASFYKDACRMMEMARKFETTTHLVAHCLREVKSCLIGLLEVITEHDPIDQEFETKKSEIKLFLEGLSLKTETPQKMIKTLISEEKPTDKEKIWKILNELDISPNSSVTNSWNFVMRKSHKISHRDSLAPARPINFEFREYWDEFNHALLGMLEKVDKQFIKFLPIIDRLALLEEPTLDDLSEIRNKLPNTYVTYEQLFMKLKSPKWIPLLRKKGFFGSPPWVEMDEEEWVTIYPRWPILEYLTRMAPGQPGLVSSVLIEIPETDNNNVKGQLLEVILALPTVRWWPIKQHIKSLMISKEKFLVPPKCITLINKLADDWDVVLAMEFSEHLLSILPSEDNSILRKPQLRMEDWHYSHFLEKDFLQLANKEPVSWIALLVKTLATYYKTYFAQTWRKGYYDSSWIERPNIEEKDWLRVHEIPDSLIEAILTIAKTALAKDPKLLSKLLTVISKGRYNVFSRIVLCLVSQNYNIRPRTTKKYLKNTKYLDKPIREYAILVDKAFWILDKDEQISVLNEIIDKRNGLSDELMLEYLEVFKKYLFWKFRRKYAQLVPKYGPIEDPKEIRPIFSSTFYGPSSPLGQDKMEAMPIEEIIKFLAEWKPGAERHGPTRSGLWMQLQETLKQHVDVFSWNLRAFMGLDPTYINSLLRWFAAVVQTKVVFDWTQLIELCLWVLKQPREISGREKIDTFDQDEDWWWTRRAMISLISHWLNFDAIPIKFQHDIWAMIRILAEDIDPLPEDEVNKEWETRDDAYHITINSVRGEAISSVVEFGLWLIRNWWKWILDLKLDDLKWVLEKHLYYDNSIWVRAAYAHNFSYLFVLDKEWALSLVKYIFPLSEANTPLYTAAWSTYLSYTYVKGDTFQFLSENYKYALENLAPSKAEEHDTIQSGLVAHIMTLFLWGKFDLNDKESLFAFFWEHANEHMRYEAIRFIGLSLEQINEPNTLDMLKVFWETRIQQASQADDKKKYQEEFSAFSFWFNGWKFDAQWSTQQFIKSLDICKKPESIYTVLDRLKELNNDDQFSALDVLEKLVLVGTVFYGDTDVRHILDSALQSWNKLLIAKAKTIISRLATRGSSAYLNLL